MHQPLIPAGGGDLHTAEIISNLKHMMDNPGIGDNHNASVFHWCYKRMGEFIPQLVDEGKQPRVMLDYSGTLLHGLRQMGLNDVFDNLKRDHLRSRATAAAVEWLGCAVGPRGGAVHAGAGLPPARQGLAASLRGDLRPGGAAAACAASRRRRWRCPTIRTSPTSSSRRSGIAATVGAGAGAHRRAAGERPRARSASTCRTGSSAATRAGETASIIAIIKTQGSDTKLVAQMQPYYEAKGLSRWELAGKQVPPLVTQIADGENGGVMMNEFPPKYHGGHARMLRLGHAGHERHRVPGAPVRVWASRRRTCRRPAHLPEADLGPVQAGRRPGAAGAR